MNNMPKVFSSVMYSQRLDSEISYTYLVYFSLLSANKEEIVNLFMEVK